jgi:hypothetical protein
MRSAFSPHSVGNVPVRLYVRKFIKLTAAAERIKRLNQITRKKHKKMVVAQLAKKFPSFNETPTFMS